MPQQIWTHTCVKDGSSHPMGRPVRRTCAGPGECDRIVSALRQMTETGGAHNFLILELADQNRYVQFATSCGSATVLGEAVSDRFLTTPLSPEHRARLQELGWRQPTPRKWPNHFRLWNVLNDTDRQAIADIALDTLERVYEWQRGASLRVKLHLDW